MYDIGTHQWSEVEINSGDAPCSLRWWPATQIHKNVIYSFGGENGDGKFNDFFRCRLVPVNIPPSGLLDDFQSLVNNPELSDVRFMVQGKEVYAHQEYTCGTV